MFKDNKLPYHFEFNKKTWSFYTLIDKIDKLGTCNELYISTDKKSILRVPNQGSEVTDSPPRFIARSNIINGGSDKSEDKLEQVNIKQVIDKADGKQIKFEPAIEATICPFKHVRRRLTDEELCDEVMRIKAELNIIIIDPFIPGNFAKVTNNKNNDKNERTHCFDPNFSTECQTKEKKLFQEDLQVREKFNENKNYYRNKVFPRYSKTYPKTVAMVQMFLMKENMYQPSLEEKKNIELAERKYNKKYNKRLFALSTFCRHVVPDAVITVGGPSAVTYIATTTKKSIAAGGLTKASVSNWLALSLTAAGAMFALSGLAFSLSILSLRYKQYHAATGFAGLGFVFAGAGILLIAGLTNPVGWAVLGVGALLCLVGVVAKKYYSAHKSKKNSQLSNNNNAFIHKTKSNLVPTIGTPGIGHNIV